MITKFEKFNESIKSLLVGPTKEEIWKSLGYDKSFDTPEEFFLNVIDGMKIHEQNKYPDSIFWEKNGELIFEQDLKNNDLWVNLYSIWDVLENIFGLSYDETQKLIKSSVAEHLNWKGFTPESAQYINSRMVDENINKCDDNKI